MTPRRNFRSDEHSDSTEQFFPMLASESIRVGASRQAEPPKPNEEKISLFWRIFGGTILSIVTLLVLTAYQTISGSIHDLRTSVSSLNEAKADLLKKDEYNATRTRTWEKITELQKEVAAISTPISQLKDRVGQMDEQAKALAIDRKETNVLQATGKERLTQLEQQLASVKGGQKDVQALQQTVTALQEKSTLRDQQLKQMEDERKEMLKEVQALRERLARVEATRDAPPVKATPTTKSKPPMDDSDGGK